MLVAGRHGRRVRGVRHRHRHRAREAEDHLRGLPAGRRRHQPQVRRHRPRSRHQPRAVEPARRRDSAAQHARHGQHVHAVPAAAVRGARRAVRASPRAPARAPRPRSSPSCASPTRRPSRSRTIARDLHPGDSSLLIVEDDPHYARVLVDLARDKGFKVLVAARGAEALDLAREFHPTAISLDVFLPDMLGWTVLSHLKQDADAAPHSGADRHARRKPPARPVARRVLVHHQAGDDRGAGGSVRAHQGVRRAAAQAPARSSRTTTPSSSASRSCSATTTSTIVTAGTGAEALAILQRASHRLRGARPAAAGHLRLRGAEAHARRRRRCRTCRSSCSPARSCRPSRTRSCRSWRARS